MPSFFLLFVENLLPICYIESMNTKKRIPLLIFSIAIGVIDILSTKFLPSTMAIPNIAITILTMPIFLLMAMKTAAPGVMLTQAVIRALFLLLVSPYISLVVVVFGILLELTMLGMKKKRAFYPNAVFYSIFSVLMMFRDGIAAAIPMAFQGIGETLLHTATSLELLYSVLGAVVAVVLSYFLLKGKMERAGLMKPHMSK